MLASLKFDKLLRMLRKVADDEDSPLNESV